MQLNLMSHNEEAKFLLIFQASPASIKTSFYFHPFIAWFIATKIGLHKVFFSTRALLLASFLPTVK